MSNTDYNNIISTINSVSQDYNYSPPSNNLICIDTSNNRIGINTLDPSYSLHINGGTIKATTVYTNIIVAESFQSLGDPTDDINVTAINVTNINVASKLDISQGTIKVANISVSNLLDISKGQIKANYIQTNKIDVSGTLDISRGLIKANYMQTNNIDVSGTLDISKGYIKVNNVDISGTLNISKGYIKVNNIDVSGTLDNSRGLFIANNIRTHSNIEISGNIIFNVSGGNITNVNKLSAPLTNYSIVSSSRVYQDISNDISWAAVNGYYGLAKDAYPALNPYSSGAKAVQTWTSRSVNNAIRWHGICWSPELRIFVATSDTSDTGATNHRLMWSRDGINWNPVAVELNYWRSVCWSPKHKIFVAVASGGSTNNRVMISYNGKTWIPKLLSETNLNNAWYRVIWCVELEIFVAISYGFITTTNTNRVMYSRSSDASTWIEVNLGSTLGSLEWYGLCWSPELGIFVATANNNSNGINVMTSRNGINWTPQVGSSTNGWVGVCWSPERGLFVAVAYGGTNQRIMTSEDGKTWITNTQILQYNLQLWNVCWCSELKLFVAIGSDKNGDGMATSGIHTYGVITSPNGKTWTQINLANVSSWSNICWSPELGIFVIIAFVGVINLMTSSLQGRPSTSTNVFDNSFNAIDENGSWTVKQLTVSDLSSVNISNFINSLITRINYLETYAITQTKDIIGRSLPSITIPIDLFNNDSVEINASFGFTGYNGTTNYTLPSSTLRCYYTDISNVDKNFNSYTIEAKIHRANAGPYRVYFGNINYAGMVMWNMATAPYDISYIQSYNLIIRLYRPKYNGAISNMEGESYFSTNGHGPSRATFSCSFDSQPKEIILWTHSTTALPLNFDILYSTTSKKRAI